MAKITTEYDTKEKTLKVHKDGQEIPNVRHAEFGQSYDDESKHVCHVMTSEDSGDGYRTHTHLVASESGELEKQEGTNPGLAKLIGKYLGRNR